MSKTKAEKAVNFIRTEASQNSTEKNVSKNPFQPKVGKNIHKNDSPNRLI